MQFENDVLRLALIRYKKTIVKDCNLVLQRDRLGFETKASDWNIKTL